MSPLLPYPPAPVRHAHAQAAHALLDPQLWCVGRDIVHPDGNALLRYGFERVRPPAGETGSSAYLLRLPNGGRCVLWGFAVLCDSPAFGGALLLRRHPYSARLAEAAAVRLPLWRVEQLPATTVARTPDARRLSHRLAAAAARALAAYERWTLVTLGVDHRLRCEAERPREVRRRQSVRCAALGDAWDAFAARAERLAATDES